MKLGNFYIKSFDISILKAQQWFQIKLPALFIYLIINNLALFQQLVSNPYLIVDGVSRFDFAQGKVGKY